MKHMATEAAPDKPTQISLVQLRNDWDKMHPLDRAKAVRAHKQAGMHVREISRQIGRPDSSLRHLLIALEAPAADIWLARKGKISINELVRRARSEQAQLAASRQKEEEKTREKEAAKAASVINGWLEGTGLNGPSCETIINLVREQLAWHEQNGTLPVRPERLKKAIAEIIQACKPPELNDDRVTFDGWIAAWLSNWVFWAFPDSDLRSNALDIALAFQQKRPALSQLYRIR